MNRKLQTLLANLERNVGTEFLATDAFASYTGFRDRLSAAYADASPEWADIIRGQASVMLASELAPAHKAAYSDLQFA
jgi:hypothetical protein